MKFLFASLLVVGVQGAASPLPVDDGDFSCLDRAKAESYVRDFNIDLSSFGGLELCDSNVDTKKLFNDLGLVEEGHFGAGKQNIFIRGIVPGDQYFSWLKSMTSSIRRGHDIPYATAYNMWGNFTMQDGWTHLSTLGRVGTLIHEARHTDGYSHMRCAHGPYQESSVSGCDSSISQEGAHAVEMEYYSRVALQGQNFHPTYQAMARLMNLARANFVFNENPMTQAEGLVAHSGDKIVLLAQNQTPAEQSVAGLGQFELRRTSFGASLYDGQVAMAVDLYNPSQQPVVDVYSYYKLLLDGRLADVADMQEVDINNRRFLVALTKKGQLHSFIFGEGEWSQGVSAQDAVRLITTAPDGQEGLFVVTSDGQVQTLNPETLTRSGKGAWPQGFVEFVNWNGAHLAVDQAGHVWETGSNKEFTPLADRSVQQMVRAPLFNPFDRMPTQVQ